MRRIWVVLMMVLVAGCGGGGGGSQYEMQPPAAQAPPTVAVVRLLYNNQAGNAGIAGITARVLLPDGVTGKSSGGTFDATSITGVGQAAASQVAQAVYVPATADNRGYIDFTLLSTAAGGFGTGEFANITLNNATGKVFAADEFRVVNSMVTLLPDYSLLSNQTIVVDLDQL